MKSNFEGLKRKRGRPRKVELPEVTDVSDISEATESSESPGIRESPDISDLRAIAEAADLDEALEEKNISAEAYDALLLNSKGSSGMQYPWKKHEPNAVRKLQRPFRFNEYEKALFHFVAGARQTTVNKLMLKLLRKEALAIVRRMER